MKKVLTGTVLVMLLFIIVTSASAGGGGNKKDCTRIQDGILLTSDGLPIETGFDSWGYNYQAHLFNGMYCDIYHDAAWCQPFKDIRVVMKWNDAWISNMDCDGDGLLDRHYDYPSYIGSGAWETVHMSGTYESDGRTCHWNDFQKIIAVPFGANLVDGVWYAANGTEFGIELPDWGGLQFAIIQQVTNDPCAGLHGLQYVSPDHAGLGNW